MGKNDVQAQQTQSQFGFTAIKIEKLTGSKYCVAKLVIDNSGSVSGFKNELEEVGNIVIKATKKSPEAENVLLAGTTFQGSSVNEIHGFIPVPNLPDDQYTNKFNPGGATPLYDAAMDAIESVEMFAKQLVDQDFMVNGILFIVTDGEECSSRRVHSASRLKETLDRIRKEESVESLVAILIGVNDSNCRGALDAFKTDAGFDHYISIGDADPGKLAKLGQLISQSVSSQSQSIGSGGPSKAINFTL